MRSNQRREERAQRAARLRDLEDRQASLGSKHAMELVEGGVEIRDVPHPEADRRGIEHPVVERQREEVALDPLDGVATCVGRARACAGEKSSPVTTAPFRSAATARSPVPQQASSTRSPECTTASTVSRRQDRSRPTVMTRFMTS